MRRPVKVLVVEDSEDDTKLALKALRRFGFDPAYARVQTAVDFEKALAGESWDAVISDYAMPGFTGLDALARFRAREHDMPFILVSGTVGEQFAADAMKAGASDYVMKGSLERLGPALARELKEAETRAHNRAARKALDESELRFRQIAANIRDVFLLFEAGSGRILYASPAYEEIWGRSCASLYENQASWFEAIHPDDRESARKAHGDGLAGAQFQCAYRIQRPDETVRWMEVRGFPVRDSAGETTRVAAIVVDVTEHANSEDRIRRLNRVYAMMSAVNALTVRVRDRDELFREACRISVEQGHFRMAWIGLVEKPGAKLTTAASAGMSQEVLEHLERRFSCPEESWPRDSLVLAAMRSKQPRVFNDMHDASSPGIGDGCEGLGVGSFVILPFVVADEVVGVFKLFARETGFFDAAELKLLTQLVGDIAYAIDHIDKQALLDYLAYYDVLTGLANRRLFLERLAQHERSASVAQHNVALYLMDLERFKNVNDTLGSPAGDMLLRQVAQWLTIHTGDANLLARVGADQFAILLPQAGGGEDAARYLEKMMQALLQHEFQLNDVVLRVPVKVGVALFPDDGGSADILFGNAEAALKKAKASGERYLFYTQRMTDAVSGRLTLENQLRRGLDAGEFVLHYQPKVSLATGKLTSAEALIRWEDPGSGLVPPGRFIPVLEETGLIHDVGRWALRTAVGEYLRWRALGLPAVRIAVNVSPLQLRSRTFVDEIRQAIGIDRHAAEGLELEITESLIMADLQLSIATLTAIRDLGVTIAIDDFGTGFSSLSYLAKLPVDTLKIDRSFVVEMMSSPQGLALVSTVVNLAHALKLEVVAEGVETQEQSRMLRLLGCDQMQGFLFSKAVPSASFEAQFLARFPEAPPPAPTHVNERGPDLRVPA